MELSITKTERQRIGAEKWRANFGIGTLNWPPRFGKTFGTIEFIANPHLHNNTANSIVILTPSEIIAKQWKDNLISYCEDITRVKVYTASHFASNPEVKDVCTLLIVDELQKFTTDERKTLIDGNRIIYHYKLGLTGTYPKDIDWINNLFPIVDTIEEKEAIDNKWISPYIEFNVVLELPYADKVKYEKFSKPITETLTMFKPLLDVLVRENKIRLFENEFDLIYACKRGFQTVSLTGIDKWITYDALCNTIAYMKGWHTELNISIPENKLLHETWSPIAIHNRAKQFTEYIERRNNLLVNNNVKLEMVANIISRNRVSTIIFNESTEFADRISDYLNAKFDGLYRVACYHSKMDSRTMIDPTTGDYFKFSTGDRKGTPKMLGNKSIKNIVIEGFKNGFYHALSTARALDEGLDVPIIEQVICTGGTTNPLTYQQRTARGKTVDFYNPNKITKIFNLVFNDFENESGELIRSRDRTKLVLRQKETASSVKWITDLNEINFSTTE